VLSIYLSAVWDVLLELAPWLLLGAVAAGLLHVLVPRDLIQRHLSGRGGVLKAVLLGVPLPLCSCGVIPAGIGLKRDGASNGAAIGFLTATPQTGVDSILVSASFLGWPFALAKVGAAVATGLTSGLLADAVSDNATSTITPPASAATASSGRGWGELVGHGVDLIRMIWGWLVFGVLLSAALTTFLPAGGLGGWEGAGMATAFALALVVSLPLYVCATASVPIAAALVAAGMPTGAAMVFLMAGPATNVATLGAVYRAFGGRIVGIYLGTIVIGSVAFGLLYEATLGAVTVSSVAGGHAHTAWWAQLAAVVLVGMIVWFIGEDARLWLARRRAAASAAAQVTVSVSGMTCGGCASRLERLMMQLDGVESVTVSLEPGSVTVAGAVSADGVREVVEQAGFQAVA
jgi:uncharacterized membrane protein YraQ (UPF0718 family)/copper chaperone CopZ